MKYLRKDFVHKFQDGNGRNRVHWQWHFDILEKNIFLKFHFRLPSHKNHYHNHSDICLDYPKIISEKWNLAVNFNCQEAKIITLLFAVMDVVVRTTLVVGVRTLCA